MLALAVVAFFWQVVFDGAMMPRGGGDLASFLYPRYVFAADAFHHGVLPLWNPYLFSGSPFLADIQSGLFYPFNLLAFAAFAPFTYPELEAMATLHFWLAGVFHYAFLRSLGLGRIPCLLGAITFAFSGFMVTHLGHLNMVETAVWLPLVLLFFRRGALLLSAICLAFAYFAGHAQLFLYLLLALGLYALWVGLLGPWLAPNQRPISSRTVRSPARPLVAAGLVGAAAFLLVACQLLPNYELVRLSPRAEISLAESSRFAAQPVGLLTLLVPHFFGKNATNYWGEWTTTETFGYVGLLPLLLALLGAARFRRVREAQYFALLAMLGLLLALGDTTALHGWLYRFVPGFAKVRAPGRFLFFFDIGVAVLAAYGAQTLLLEVGRARRARLAWLARVAWVVLAVTCVGALPVGYHALLVSQHEDAVIYHRIATAVNGVALFALLLALCAALLGTARRGWLRGRALAGATLVLVAVDLASAGIGFNPAYEDLLKNFRQERIVNFLRADDPYVRIDDVTGVEDVWQPDTAEIYHLYDVWGLFNPVTVADYDAFWRTYLPGRSSRLYDLLNARYLIAHRDVKLDVDKFHLVYGDDPRASVFRNDAALPRAFVVPNALSAPDHATALRLLLEPGFDPASCVILEGAATPRPGGNGTARIIALTPNHLEASVEAPEGGYLVLSSVYYPGWRAEVDGRATPLLRADWAFQAIALPPNAHRVVLRFLPTSFLVGAAISLPAWLAALGWLGWQAVRHRVGRAS